MNGPMVLPEDIRIVPLSELSPAVREQLAGEDGDYALTRPHSRTPSKVIDSNGAALLKQFEEPTTIVDAILRYSRSINASPHDVLDQAYSLIETCLVAKLLVEPGENAAKIEPSFKEGDSIAEYVVDKPIQALEDSEVYRVHTLDGEPAALKIARQNAGSHMRHLLKREAETLQLLDGRVTPKFLASGAADGQRPFLLIEWIDGTDSDRASHELRQRVSTRELLDLCAAILDAYATLHSQGLIHSDVHPRNVLLATDGTARIIDFGVGRFDAPDAKPSPRAGIGFFFEPEYAKAVLERTPVPPSSFLGEQYSLAALAYFLLAGSHYLDFSFTREEMMRQIAEDLPLPLATRNVELPARVEAVLFRALQKDPTERFETTADFARSFGDAIALRAETANHSGDDLRQFVDDVVNEISDPENMPEYQGPASPTGSVNYGAAGIAYALLRIARARDDGRLLALADLWAEKAASEADHEGSFYNPAVQITPETVGRISPFHTASGVAAVQAFVALSRGDLEGLERATTSFLERSAGTCENLDLTIGRTSTLLALSLLLEAAAPERPETLLDYGNGILTGIWDELAGSGSMRDDSLISYLGMAHGWAGLLYGAMRWSEAAGRPLPAGVEPRLEELADLADFTRHGARWTVQVGKPGMYMSGWCNGSTGYVHLWTRAHRVFGSGRYLDLAEKAGADAYASAGGGHSLCCGYAGQAYSQLALYKHTNEARWRDQAVDLTTRAAAFGSAMVRRGEDGLPHSLYKGNVGVAVLAAELKNPKAASMPFFEEEGWLSHSKTRSAPIKDSLPRL